MLFDGILVSNPYPNPRLMFNNAKWNRSRILWVLKNAHEITQLTRAYSRRLNNLLLFLSYRIKRQQVLSSSSILRERYTRFELCHIISVGCRTGTDSFSECQNKRNMRGVIVLYQLTQSQTSIIVCNELK